MVQKPKIQYVGEFYIRGSEARKLDLGKTWQKAKTRLPLARLEKVEKIYIDPIAIGSIFVALFMLVTMTVGALRIYTDWQEYEQISGYVMKLNQENVRLNREYRNSYDLEDIRQKAVGLGFVSLDSIETKTVTVTLPEPEPEVTWVEELNLFWKGLWE